MKTKMLLIGVLAALSITPLKAQVFPSDPQPPTVGAGFQNIFDLNDTNSLVHANEVNLSVGPKWNSATDEVGGVLDVSWWVTDQQGAFFGFEEYSSRTSYLSLGYQARTVFKGLEIALGVGTRQNSDDPIGDVQMFLRPTVTKQIYASENWDLRFTAGCDVLNQGKPNPFAMLTVRALRF
jgi:hypothetical protein